METNKRTNLDRDVRHLLTCLENGDLLDGPEMTSAVFGVLTGWLGVLSPRRRAEECRIIVRAVATTWSRCFEGEKVTLLPLHLLIDEGMKAFREPWHCMYSRQLRVEAEPDGKRDPWDE